MDALHVALFVGAGLATGVVTAALWARAWLRRAAREARTASERARQQSHSVREGAAEARARQATRFAEEAADELARTREGLADLESALDEREAIVNEREQRAAGAEDEVEARHGLVAQVLAQGEQLAQECREHEAARLVALEAAGNLHRGPAVEQVVAELLADARLRAQKLTRRLEQEWENESASAAARVMAMALERYNGVGHLERIQNTVAIGDAPTLRAFADAAGATHTAFAEGTGCTLVCDETDHSATVRGDDPLAREIARRVLRQIANRNTRDAGEVRKMTAQVKDEVEREVHNAGRKALRVLDIDRVHPEILHLVGRLKFRLSYSQNQWKHAIEVGYLAGLIACELGIDVALAHRAGLLHDIGKAMTHEREGAHAVLGAEVARRCGEDEQVANAIGSHHFDEPPQGALAYVVTAADALSGARPGARRENAAHYLQHIRDIQAIASRSPGVQRVDVMHAGREVRVVVTGREQGAGAQSQERVLGDGDLYPLAQEIARAIEAELTFAGQIRVTVIRESRAVSVAY
ncbi:MAG: DUF3552 domain-containing protein [Deltaproteobacteria bacterium]|nr:DUF3552 domain-containing protein [Deltaproteobacteria bacterium]